jgi:hypothetical protein
LTSCEIDSLSTFPVITEVKEIARVARELSFYPNPTSGLLKVVFEKEFLGARLQLKNIAGQTIFAKKIVQTGSENLTISGPSGIYFLELISADGEISVSKVIKQ